MELVLVLLSLGISLILTIGAVCGLVAMGRIARLSARVRELERMAVAGAPAMAPVVERAPMSSHAAEAATVPASASASAQAPAPAPAPLRPSVGTDAPPAREAEPRRSLEETIGASWTTWGGAAAMFVAVALFLELAFDRGWIGPGARVAMAAAFGLALIVVGDRCARRSLRAMGQGLLGAGLAILHAAVFAGFFYAELYPQPVAFGLLVVTTGVGVALAVHHDAPPIAFLSVLGGFLTPVLVATGTDARDALFGYLAVLDLGVLGVAFFKRWRALDVLAFAGTWILFGGWFDRYYQATSAAPTIAWLTVFYAVFLLLPFVHHLRRRVALDVERFVAGLGNAAAAFGYSQAILGHDSRLLGAIALGMATAYLALGALTRRRLPGDRRALVGFATLAMFFLTLSVPLYFGLHGWTLAWAAEGPVLCLLGYHYRYYPVRLGGLAVMGLAAARALLLYQPAWEAAWGAPWLALDGARAATALAVPLALAGYALLHVRFRAIAERRDHPLRRASSVAAGLLALVVVQLELFAAWGDAARPVSIALWTLGTAGYLGFARRGSTIAWQSAVATSLVATGLAALLCLDDGVGIGTLFLNHRFAAALVAVLGLFAVASLARGRDASGALVAQPAPVMAGLAQASLWLLLSAETVDHFENRDAADLAQPAMSVVWALYAVALIAQGLRRDQRTTRMVGLALFALTAVKLVVIDLDGVDQVYRALAFLVVGLLLTAASYLYHRFGDRLRPDPAVCPAPGAGSAALR